MDIIDKYDYKKIKLKGHVFQTLISEPFKNEYIMNVNFIKTPDVISPDIFVSILEKMKPDVPEGGAISIIGAKVNTVDILELLGIKNDSWRFKPVDDEIKRFKEHQGKQIDLSEPLRIGGIKKLKAEKTLEHLKRKYNQINQFKLSLSYEVYIQMRTQNQKLIPTLTVVIFLQYSDPDFRAKNKDFYIGVKNKIKDDFIEYCPFDLKTYDTVEVQSSYTPLQS